jgi:hypothetical protein
VSYPRGGPAGQVCAVCLFAREGSAEDAVTTIRGYAVCEDHMTLVAQGMEWSTIIGSARGMATPPPAEG